MLIKNTSQYPDGEVRELLAFAGDGLDLRHVAVHVKNSKHAYAGMAYERVPRRANTAATAQRLVSLRIGPPGKFPADNMRTTVRWVDVPGYADIPDTGFVENVLGITYGSDEYNAWWQTHRIWTCYREGVQTNRVQRLVRTRTPYGGKGSPLIEMLSWQEALVALAAHEFTHIRQYQNNWPRSEVQCELYAAKRLDAYRNKDA